MRSRQPILIVAFLLLLASAAAADDLELSILASLDGGPAIGAAVSWHAADLGSLECWLDAGCKREDSSTAALLGASTPAVALLQELPVLRAIAPALDRSFAAKSRVGIGLLSTGEPLAYIAHAITF